MPTAPDDADTTPVTVGIINAVYTGACQGEKQDSPPSMSDLSLLIVGILTSACVKFASAQSIGEKFCLKQGVLCSYGWHTHGDVPQKHAAGWRTAFVLLCFLFFFMMMIISPSSSFSFSSFFFFSSSSSSSSSSPLYLFSFSSFSSLSSYFSSPSPLPLFLLLLFLLISSSSFSSSCSSLFSFFFSSSSSFFFFLHHHFIVLLHPLLLPLLLLSLLMPLLRTKTLLSFDPPLITNFSQRVRYLATMCQLPPSHSDQYDN